MKNTGIMAGAIALSLLGTGCATKKYVAKTVAPVEQRVSAAEKKDADQDKTIASQGTEIQEIDRSLSQTTERLNGKIADVDGKATQAGQAAQAADQHAGAAQQSANGARQAADAASQGVDRLGRTVDAMNRFQMTKSETVLFAVNRDTLTPEARQQLDEVATQVNGMDRFVIEVQGFTDKTGGAEYNAALSARRAEAVARYLTTEHKIPVRSISMLGEGYAAPVADDKTRDGRKQNRRVEVRLWVPDAASKSVASNSGQQ
jgi:outer membrane protein OmpA-like peptidoglycan-associated protein